MLFFAIIMIIALFCSFDSLRFSIKNWKDPKQSRFKLFVIFISGTLLLIAIIYVVFQYYIYVLRLAI